MGVLFFTAILMAIVLGYLLPFYALWMGRYSFIPLAILLFASSTVIDWSRFNLKETSIKTIVVSLLIAYLSLPLLQWGLASILISDSTLVFGVLYSSLAPMAIVAPYFVSLRGGDKELSFLLVLITTLLFPFYSSGLLSLLDIDKVTFFTKPIFLFSLLLFTLPTAVGILTRKYSTKLTEMIKRHWGIINIVSLSILIFSIFGSAVNQVSHQISGSDIAALIGLSLFQDVGVYLLSLFLLPTFFDRRVTETLAITLSLKNVAATGVLLLLYWPNAAIASATVFLFHLMMFTYLEVTGRKASSAKNPPEKSSVEPA